MAQWKLVMGSFRKDVKKFGSSDTEEKTIYVILTNDSLQLILREYTESDKSNFDIEIDGKYYKTFGNGIKYVPDYTYAVKAYQKYWMQYNPTKDIKTNKDVIELYESMHEKASELYKLK